MKCHALFLLTVAVLNGCISDSRENGAMVLRHERLFEVGRHAELEGNFKVAEDTYGWLIEGRSLYGRYGLAMLLLKHHPDRRKEAVKHLLSCAERPSNLFDQDSESAIDVAFSVAAMAKLSDIAESELNRPDVAMLLRCKMSETVTPEVKKWAAAIKTDADSAANFREIILAVESDFQRRERAKTLKWKEISKVFLNEESDVVGIKGK